MNPNILILSRGFRSGDAITTLNLFSQWPKDNLYCASLTDSEYTADFKDFYHIGAHEVYYAFPFNHFSQPKPSRVGAVAIQPKEISALPSRKKKIYEHWIRPVLQWLDLYESRTNIIVSDDFAKWIEKIQPKAIYTSIGDISMAKFILRIHERFPDIKIIIHGFDDWLSPPYKIWNDKLHRYKAESLFQKILKISVARFTSSEKMADDYQKRYRLDFKCFPNPVETSDFECEITKNETPNIVFTGKVGWHNADAIKVMIKVVETINQEGTLLHFDVYTQTPKSHLDLLLGYIPTTTIIHTPVHNKNIPQILGSAHLLYLPISIDRQTAKFTRYSMSTKVGEYLSSGCPVIYMGPADIAMTEFLKDKECSYLLTEKDADILKYLIYTCLSVKNNVILKRGKLVAERYFNKAAVSKSFYEAVQQVID